MFKILWQRCSQAGQCRALAIKEYFFRRKKYLKFDKRPTNLELVADNNIQVFSNIWQNYSKELSEALEILIYLKESDIIQNEKKDITHLQQHRDSASILKEFLENCTRYVIRKQKEELMQKIISNRGKK
jgi:hypothetical protein